MLEEAARRWIGLTLGHCTHSAPFTLHDVVLDEPALVLWLSDAPQLRIVRGAGHWTLHPREGLFDYYPAGLYALVQRAAGAAHALKMNIGAQWRQALGLQAHDDRTAACDSQPSFQFREPRLARLVRQLNAWHERAGSRLHAIDLAHLQQATLACWAEHQAATPRHRPPAHDAHTAELPEPTRRLVADVVDDTLCSDLTVHELAVLTGYSEAQFVRRFKASFHMPPHRYILARRVERAKHLLHASDRTLTDIAQQLGFASHAHFSTAFKLRTGTTPSAFRRQPAPQGAAGGAPCECR